MIDSDRFLEIVERFPQVRLAVFGDFFLDKYLVIDPVLAEMSLETELEAFQVVAMRSSPGAAGTVTNNLAALEIGSILAIGAIGDDGHGYELRQGLHRTGVDMTHLLVLDEIFTPTYTKPMVIDDEGVEVESNRVDIKNRRPLTENTQARLIEELVAALPEVDAVIIADQVEESHLGVVTDHVRMQIAEIAAANPDKVFFADSRASCSAFRNVIIKPNAREAAQCLALPSEDEATLAQLSDMGQQLAVRNARPVYITLGPNGMLVCTEEGATHVPGVAVEGPLDICGAGDSATAGIVSALCAGASFEEAAFFGNLIASITIQKIGTTGTASPAEVLQRFVDCVGE
jgi:rfaE bifunctional protein kinase chain/domain